MWSRLASQTLATCGLELHRCRWTARNLRKPGFGPGTLIDVGVGFGTPQLYAAFPDAHLVLIEPLKEFETRVRGILQRHKGEYLLTAVGAHEGTVTIQVDTANYERSSVLARSRLMATGSPLIPREVPVTTLDAVAAERSWFPPFGLKIDTEGFELPVLEGASQLLAATQFVIAEVSVARRFAESYSFADFIGAMDARGFRLCDILGIARSGTELKYMDLLFRPYEEREGVTRPPGVP